MTDLLTPDEVREIHQRYDRIRPGGLKKVRARHWLRRLCRDYLTLYARVKWLEEVNVEAEKLTRLAHTQLGHHHD